MKPVNPMKRLFSLCTVLALVLSGLFALMMWSVPSAMAPSVRLTHDAGNLDFKVDNHTSLPPYITFNGVQQSDWVGSSTNYVYFFFDQSDYDHTGGDIDIAAGRESVFGVEEFETTVADTPLSLLNDGVMDKSFGSFTKVADIAGKTANDIRVFQTAWSIQGEDWAIIKWTIQNLYATSLTEVRFGFHFLSCIAGDNDDDTDYWNSSDKVFYFTDSDAPTHIGFASADAGTPINLYKGSDNLQTDETIYNAITGPFGTSGLTESIYSVTGWTDDEIANNGLTIPAGGNITRAMIIAGGDSYAEILNAIDSARQFYLSQTLMITEVSDEGTRRVEIFNSASKPIDLTNFRLSVNNGASYWTGGSWSNNPILGNDYSIWTLGGADAFDNTEGDTLSLWNTSSSKKYDEVAFGQEGVAPDPYNDPLYGSISRVPGGGGYSTEWVHSLHGMTFGTQNNENPINHDPLVILNEVMFNPAASQYGFLEIIYIGDAAIDIDGYIVVCDSVIQFSGTWILDTSDPFKVVLESDAPAFFAGMTPANDNVYLYDYNGTLLDMVGWSSTHALNSTVTRIPDGFGTYQGYEDVTSVAAGWVFDQAPTIPLVHIGPAGQFGYGEQGDVVWYNLTITNHLSTGELFDLLSESLPNGWLVEIYLENGVTKITDSDGDGIPDIFVSGNSSVNIKIKVTIPSIWDVGNYDNTTIIVRANINPAIAFRVMVQTRVYPYLVPEKSITPSQINVKGTGYDEEATITLNVSGSGSPTVNFTAQDVILILDSSGSMEWNDPSDLRKTAAKNYVDRLKPGDRAAVVDLDAMATLLIGLTDDFVAVKAAIDTIDSEGGTSVSPALDAAISELENNGDPEHIWAIILLTDAEDLLQPDIDECYIQAGRAAALEIIIFTIGLGIDTPQEEQLLQDIADITGGDYYPTTDPAYLDAIYNAIAAKLSQIAGWDVNTDDASPMIRDVLPPWIDFVPGSFIDPSTGAPRDPDYWYVDASGYTILEWNVSTISIGQTWSVSFNITSSMNGYVEANNFTTSRINYTNWANSSVELLFPKTMINVMIGEPLPPELFIEVVDGLGNPDGKGDHIRLSWIPPSTPKTFYYLIYRSTSQTDFDFSLPWRNTMTYNDNGFIPLRTTLNCTNDASISPQEYYYVVRAVNTGGEVSDTSRTVGKYTNTFPAGVSTFSIPLEPLQPIWTDDYTSDMNANYIKYMNTGTHTWLQHNQGDGGLNNIQMELGGGFEVEFPTSTKYTFVGMPGAMILYDNISFGFDAQPVIGDADSLTASVDSGGTVTLGWAQPSSMSPGDQYYVFRSTERDGFWGTFNVDYIRIAILPYNSLSLPDNSIAQDDTEYYYMIVPVDFATGELGSSSYSIGVWTEGYLDQYDTMGIPLKLGAYQTADWYCDRIDNTVGINYFDDSDNIWEWHSTRMPENAFDTTLGRGLGYQISTQTLTKYSFVGT